MKIENVKQVKSLDKEIENILKNVETSKSMKMKQLFLLGLGIKEISVRLNVRYNFVYNVISNYVIVEGISVIQETKENKKDKIVELFNQGKSNKEISITLKTNYNYVYKITKELKQQQLTKKEG